LQRAGDVACRDYADDPASLVDHNSATISATLHALQEIDESILRVDRRYLARRASDVL
jgi:hypothetical protein